MQTRFFRENDKPVSLLGLGCMRLPIIDGNDAAIDYEKAQELVDYAYANGVNYFDTAHGYHGGQSQVFLGKALKKYPRDSYYLATKLPLWNVKSKDDIVKIFERQLELLDTEYVDFYLLHSLDANNYKRSLDFDAYEFIADRQARGRIKYIGFSFHDTPELLEEIAGRFRWDFAQLQINYVDWKNQQADRQYAILEQKGIPCIVMEPVRGGSLARPGEKAQTILELADAHASPASWALRYAASFPNVFTVLSGMSDMDQLTENIRLMSEFKPLTEDDYAVLAKAAEAYNLRDLIPCTACRYCMDCPSGVDIPGLFELYNRYVRDKDKQEFIRMYKQVPAAAQAEHCTQCGACAPQCPQGIDIPAKIDHIDNLFIKFGG